MKSKNKKSGFTLVELLVVISIISLLSTIVLSALNAARIKANDAHRLGSFNQIEIAIENFYADNGYYPIVFHENCTGNNPNTPNGWEDLQTSLIPKYISLLPQDIAPFVYHYCSDRGPGSSGGTPQEYVLGTQLQVNSPALGASFKGFFDTEWALDDIYCNGPLIYCIAVCRNVPGREGPLNQSWYPPNCGSY